MKPIRITMLTAGLGLTGTPRVMMDIIENINHSQFEISIAYKPEYSGSDLDLIEDLKNLGLKLIPLRGKNLFDFRGLFDLYRHLKKDSVQIVHCWDTLRLAARIMRLFIRFSVVESYCNPIVSKGSFMYFFSNKYTSLLVNGIIFCSEHVLNSFKQNKVISLAKKHISIIANCINTSPINNMIFDNEKIRNKWSINQNETILASVGYFNEQKGHEYLLDAMKIVLDEIPQVKLILVGWGALEDKLRRKAKELDIEEKIIFAGKCQRDTVFEILSITDVFVLASLWEGFGLVLGEAMAMGKPVVCTETDGSKIVVQHNETGLIVPPKSPRDLADAVTYLVGNPDLRKRMGQLGKKRVSTLFRPGKFIREHEAFYKKVHQSR